jgi:hypothetical protein
VADHRGVGEQEQRFSDQRTECGYREAQDLAIDGAAAEDVDASSLATRFALTRPETERPEAQTRPKTSRR